MSLNVIVDQEGKCKLLVDDGIEFSEDTVKAALSAHVKFEKFKAGDVAMSGTRYIRVIYKTKCNSEKNSELYDRVFQFSCHQ